MSQKKVDAYKQKKANRDKIIKKEKRILFLEKAAGVMICLAVVVWLGYSVYGKVTQQEETKTTETVMDASAVTSIPMNWQKKSQIHRTHRKQKMR